MTTQRIYLFRHGEVEQQFHHRYVGHIDAPLSEIGKRQAKAIHHFIATLENPIIITSDLRRTYCELQLPLLQKKELREINFGKWDGSSWNEIELSFSDQAEKFLTKPMAFTFPSGESYSQFSERVLPAFHTLLGQKSEYKNVVFVIHAGVIRTLLSALLGIPLEKIFNFQLDYGRCTILERINNEYFLLSWNERLNVSC